MWNSSSHESLRLREELEQQNRLIEFFRLDLQAEKKANEELRQQNRVMDGRMAFVDEHIRRLVSGVPQVPPTHPTHSPTIGHHTVVGLLSEVVRQLIDLGTIDSPPPHVLFHAGRCCSLLHRIAVLPPGPQVRILLLTC